MMLTVEPWTKSTDPMQSFDDWSYWFRDKLTEHQTMVDPNWFDSLDVSTQAALFSICCELVTPNTEAT